MPADGLSVAGLAAIPAVGGGGFRKCRFAVTPFSVFCVKSGGGGGNTSQAT